MTNIGIVMEFRFGWLTLRDNDRHIIRPERVRIGEAVIGLVLSLP